MKTKDVLKITGITRTHLSRLVKQGKIGVIKQPNGYYIYNAPDVYNYVGKKRCNLKVIDARVSTPKQRADLTRQIETFPKIGRSATSFGTEIIVANGNQDEKLDSEEIMNEIITLIHCFSMKHYSKRRVKRAIEVLNESTKSQNERLKKASI
jgi:predicted site-specific integrase-resolvase